MKRQTIKSMQCIIDQQAEQLSTAHREIHRLRGDNDLAHRERKLRMHLAKQEAMKLGHSVRVH